MHSSPIEVYESINCYGKHVENMTAAECEQCQMAITNYTFISVPTLLDWAQDKVNVFVSEYIVNYKYFFHSLLFIIVLVHILLHSYV